MKLSLGFSPCPNDTFIFDALVHHKIDTEGLEFDVTFDDVESLNRKTFRGELDVAKLSYHAFAYAAENYALLDSGSALGHGVGPLLICRDEPEAVRAMLSEPNAEARIGIPGKYTTANLLLSLAYPQARNKAEMVFSEIEGAVLAGEIDAGLIIHENRFTYQERGLQKILDLGDYWESRTGCAIPLGGIAVHRRLPREVQLTMNRVLRKSVEFAFAQPQSGIDFIRAHAQELSEEVMYKHIELYVNNFSIDLGVEGRRAIETLFRTGWEERVIPQPPAQIFCT